jgi:two-component system, cell cycle sensor histidine kinase and response regulator CckA
MNLLSSSSNIDTSSSLSRDEQIRASRMVSLYLPVYAGAVDRVPPSERLLVRGSGRVLFVDDDPAVRGILERAAKVLGYDPVLASDGAEAVEIYRSARNAGQHFEVVVLDLIIPGGLGATETLPLLRMLDPAVKVIIATGYNESDVLDQVVEAGFDALFSKPHTLSELSRILAKTISSTR